MARLSSSARPLRTTSLLVPLLGLVHVVLAPYSKVEESFSTQAVHDVLVHGAHRQRYDHVVFPGAVPRSFLGPIALAVVTYPLAVLGRGLGVVTNSAHVQLLMRCVLALLTARSLASLANALFAPPKLTQREARIHRACFDTITAVQFHFLFWASRTTPNSIALPAVLYALKHIAALPSSQDRFLHGIAVLTFLAATLRLELAGFLIPASILFLAGVGAGASDKPTRFLRLLQAGIIGGTSGAVASITVDTYFWKGAHALLEPRQWVWPELSGLLFNVVEGKSSEWGVSPWHTYLTSSIPKLLSATALFLVWTIVTRLQPQADRKGKAKSVPVVNNRLPNMTPIRWLLSLCAGHVGLLSLLGHKEWRFIVYTVPIFNAGAALGLRRMLTTRPRQVAALATLASTAAITALLSIISHVNYPGGVALAELERRLMAEKSSAVAPVIGTAQNKEVKVHIDVLPAMTGVTLFQSLHLSERAASRGGFGLAWLPPALPSPSPRAAGVVRYDKTEDIDRRVSNTSAVQRWAGYDVLLTDRAGCEIFDDDTAAGDESAGEGEGESQTHTAAGIQPGTTHPTSLHLFEPIFEVHAYAGGIRVRRPGAYLRDVLHPHGALRADILRGSRTSDAQSESKPEKIVGLSRAWRVLTTLLPLEVRTAPAVWVCRRRRDVGARTGELAAGRDGVGAAVK